MAGGTDHDIPANLLDLMRSSLAAAPVILFALDDAGMVLFLEGKGLLALGVAPGTGRGTSVFKIKSLPIKKSHFQQALTGYEFSATYTIAGILLETMYSPMKDASGKVCRVVCCSLDVTKRIEVEQTLDEKRSIANATTHLRSLTEMSNGIAHEVNNPLAIISGYTEQLGMITADDWLDVKKIRDIIPRIVNACQRIQRIIQTLKTFSTNPDNAPFKEIPVAEIVEGTNLLIHGQFTKKNRTLKVMDPPKDLFFECKPALVQQALFIVIKSALEDVENLEDGWASLEVNDLGRFIEFVITDSRPPPPKQTGSKIMLPFFSTRTVRMGRALGLSTVQSMVEVHRGTFSIDTKGNCTRFVMRIPKSQRAVA